jgi:hypothetical protein
MITICGMKKFNKTEFIARHPDLTPQEIYIASKKRIDPGYVYKIRARITRRMENMAAPKKAAMKDITEKLKNVSTSAKKLNSILDAAGAEKPAPHKGNTMPPTSPAPTPATPQKELSPEQKTEMLFCLIASEIGLSRAQELLSNMRGSVQKMTGSSLSMWGALLGTSFAALTALAPFWLFGKETP